MRSMGYAVVAVLSVLMLSGCSGGDVSAGAPQNEPAQNGSAQAPEVTAEVFTPIVGAVLAEPYAVPSTDGLIHLAYELVLTNVLGQQVALESVEVTGDDASLLTLAGDDLTPWVRPLGASAPGRTLEAGQRAIVTLDVVVPTLEQVPEALSHELAIAPAEAMPPMIEAHMTQAVAPTSVNPERPVVIASPVRGERWLDGNSCCDVTPHRSAINPINGSLHAPERFAIDFVQLDSQDRIFNGPIDDFASYDYFGADLYAVADGPIVSMGWDLPDEKPGAHPVGLQLSEYGGNHIVQDIGDGRYAFYAHLQGGNPEELEVGQQLARGEVLAQLGNSGNTDMPHLHFHVMDSPLPLGSNGLPFLLDEFELVGAVAEDDLMACMEKSIACKIERQDSANFDERGLLYGDVINTVSN